MDAFGAAVGLLAKHREMGFVPLPAREVRVVQGEQRLQEMLDGGVEDGVEEPDVRAPQRAREILFVVREREMEGDHPIAQSARIDAQPLADPFQESVVLDHVQRQEGRQPSRGEEVVLPVEPVPRKRRFEAAQRLVGAKVHDPDFRSADDQAVGAAPGSACDRIGIQDVDRVPQPRAIGVRAFDGRRDRTDEDERVDVGAVLAQLKPFVAGIAEGGDAVHPCDGVP